MRARFATAVVGAASIAVLAFGAPAGADVFGPISLVSAGTVAGTSHSEQADRAADTAISGDGRYVAFDGSLGGRRGVFRRDLLSGVVSVVAEGEAVQPSISEDGRYISFTTTARMDEQNDVNAAPDVYVRDMDKPDSSSCPVGWEEAASSQEACAFALASAVSGGNQGLTYTYGSNQAFEETHLGAVASGRSALSANGRLVAFVTTAASDAANPGRSAPSGLSEAAETPALQVLVRNLDTRATELVSVRRDPGGGALLDAAGQPEPVPLSGSYGAVYGGGPFPASVVFPAPWAGASISADGSTVAWMGQQIGEQAAAMQNDHARTPIYTEPLWRRIGAGQGAPTRRVTGGSDPANPACAASGEESLIVPATLADPCQGPFDTAGGSNTEPGLWTGGAIYDYLPRLSADGMTVAFIATAREVASGEELKVGESSDDLYVVDMRDGLTRVQSARRLTELAGGSTSNEARTAPIVDLGVSPDGSQVAFTTARTVFPLGSPSYVSGAGAAVGVVELYDVDFANDTLTRVTQGFNGEPSEAPSGVPGTTVSPSLSNDGNELAFSSEADNLVYGDGNRASDAFVVPRMRFAATPTPQLISPPPAGPSLGSIWSLGLTVLSRRDGTVVLQARVPAAGTLRAGAQSAVRVRLAGRTRKARGKARRARARTTVQTRTVATRSARPSAYGVSTLTLKLARSYSSLAGARGGLSATVTVTFSATGHKTLRQSVPVTFARTLHAKARKKVQPRTARSDSRRGKRR